MIETFIDGISESLHSEFGDEYTIYTEAVKQGLQKPCFFVYCISPDTSQYMGMRYERLYQFVIHYFPKTDASNHEFNNVIERLQECLEYITADDDLHRGVDMDSAIDVDALHFFVNYHFFVNKLEDSVPMEDLEQIVRTGG